MDKSRQKYLQQWLRTQQKPIKKYLNLNVLLATFSSVILVGQTYLLAALLHKLIILGEPVTDLVPYFIGLIVGFALRALILWLREKIGFSAVNYYGILFVSKFWIKSIKLARQQLTINLPEAGQPSCWNK